MLKLFAVRDREAQIYTKPFAMTTQREAKDGFEYVCNDKESPYNKHPQDYYLVELAEFCPRTGAICVNDNLTPLVHASDLIKKD